MVAEDLLRHGGEERDGVGHRQAHLLFCIFPLKQQHAVASQLHSTWVVKFLHFQKEFQEWEEEEADLGMTCKIVYLLHVVFQDTKLPSYRAGLQLSS